MLRGEWTTEELWIAFGEYEEKANRGTGADYRLAAATMAKALAEIIVMRETIASKKWA
jgi:hypothetical protein